MMVDDPDLVDAIGDALELGDAAIEELRLLRAAMGESVWHDIPESRGGGRAKRILVADTAIARIDKILERRL